MGETPDLYNEVRQLRGDVDDIRGMTETLVRLQSPEVVASMMDALAADPALKATFLAVDGKRSQEEIVAVLAEQGVPGASQPTVSRRLGKLIYEMRLVEIGGRTKQGTTYRRTRLDEILRISKELEG